MCKLQATESAECESWGVQSLRCAVYKPEFTLVSLQAEERGGLVDEEQEDGQRGCGQTW